MPSLREQKKRATSNALAAAAFSLAVEHGFEAVTTDDITSEAGVSRRTFANYYSSKHAAVVDGFLQGLGMPRWRPSDAVVEAEIPTTFPELIDSTHEFITKLLTNDANITQIQVFAEMVNSNRSIEPFIHAVAMEFRHSSSHALLSERFGQAKVGMFVGSVLGSLGGIIELIVGPLAIRPADPTASLSPAPPPALQAPEQAEPPAPFDLTTALSLLDQAFTYLRHGFADPR